MKIGNTYGAIFSISFLIHLLTMMFWKPFNNEQIYWYGLAIGILGYVWTARGLLMQNKDKSLSGFIFYLISDLALMLASGNLADELFFKPCEIELGEYIGLILGIGYIIYEVKKRKQKKTTIKATNGTGNKGSTY